MAKKLLSNTIGKLAPDNIWAFNLPAGKTCPGKGICKKYCYACKGNFRYDTVQKSHDKNWLASKSDNFISRIIGDIYKNKVAILRWHASGDFYSQDYLRKVFFIAQQTPDTQHYCYTKSLHLNWAGKPKNFRVIQSFGGKYDDQIDLTKPHARIYQKKEDIPGSYVYCGKSDIAALNNNNIAIVKH